MFSINLSNISAIYRGMIKILKFQVDIIWFHWLFFKQQYKCKWL